jgi:hypothetical protein
MLQLTTSRSAANCVCNVFRSYLLLVRTHITDTKIHTASLGFGIGGGVAVVFGVLGAVRLSFDLRDFVLSKLFAEFIARVFAFELS